MNFSIIFAKITIMKDEQNKTQNGQVDKLEGWKQIGAYLGIDTRTAQRKEKEEGLPVHRDSDSPKARVFAFKSEIDPWNNGRNVPPAQAVQPRKKWRYLKYFIGILIIAAVIFTAVFFLVLSKEYPQPADFKIINSELIILDQDNRELWRYDTGVRNLMPEDVYRKHFQYRKLARATSIRLPRILIQDLNSDGKNEVLYCVAREDQSGGAMLFLFDSKGKQLWEFRPGKEIKFGSKNYSNDYRIFGVDVYNLDNEEDPEIIIISLQCPYFPSQLVVLSLEGQVLGEYWNSGHIADLVCKDLDGDGIKEIIVGGVNNEFEEGFIAVFDSRDVQGSSPQQKDHYISRSLKPPSMKYYIRFPRTDVDILKNEYEFCSQLRLLDNGNISVTMRESYLIFEFNPNFELVDIDLTVNFQFMHRQAVREGKIASTLNKEYKQKLISGLLYYNGKEWTSKHSRVKGKRTSI